MAGYFAGTGHRGREEGRRERRIGIQGSRGETAGGRLGEPHPHVDGWGAKISGVMNAARPGESSAAYAELLGEAVKAGEPMTEAYLLEAIGSMRPEDGPATYRFLLDLLNFQRGGHSGYRAERLWYAFWRQYGHVDIDGALAQADKDESVYNEKDRVRKHIYIGWGQDNPQEALGRILTDEKLPERNRGIEGVSGEWAGHDPEATIRWALANLKGPDLATALGAIQWGSVGRGGVEGRGVAEAVTFWQNLPPSPESDAALGSLSQALLYSPYTKPEDRVQAVLAVESRGLYDSALVNAVARDFEKAKQPQEGLDVLTALTPRDGADYEGVSRLVRAWYLQDPASAGQWSQQQRGRPWMESVMRGMVDAEPPNAKGSGKRNP